MRLGIMGGTFDPIHWGHIRMAQAGLAELQLDQVLLLPDGDPPHKEPYAASGDRLNMVRLAAAEDVRFTWSDMEMLRPGRTYTVDTLLHLGGMYPGSQLTYLIGSDTLKVFDTWKTAGRVAEICDMAVVLRGTDTRDEIKRLIADLAKRFGLRAALLREPGDHISSTAIRQAARRGETLEAFVPPSVAAYIAEHGLYTTPDALPAAQSEARHLLAELGVVRRGHFVRVSGRHSDAYVQCARAFERASQSEVICRELARKFQGSDAQAVLSAAVGGLILCYEVSRAMNLPCLYCERVDGAMTLRRGFRLEPGTRVLIVEDEVTTGASVREMVEIVRALGGEVVGIGCVVDKTDGKVDFGLPYQPIISIKVENYAKSDCPMCLRGQPVDIREH